MAGTSECGQLRGLSAVSRSGGGRLRRGWTASAGAGWLPVQIRIQEKMRPKL